MFLHRSVTCTRVKNYVCVHFHSKITALVFQFHSFIFLFIHLFIHSSVHLFIHSFIHSFIFLFLHLFIHSLIHLSIFSFILSLINPSIHSSFHSLIHLFNFSFIHSFFHSFIHSFIHPFIHLFIHSFIFSFIHLFIHSSFHSFIYADTPRNTDSIVRVFQTGGIFSGDHVYRLHPLTEKIKKKLSLKRHQGYHVITRRSLKHTGNPGFYPEPIEGNRTLTQSYVTVTVPSGRAVPCSVQSRAEIE